MATAVPPARYLLVLWAVPRNYGGLTTVTFQHARLLASAPGADVSVVSLGFQLDGDVLRLDLLARGVIDAPERLRNLHDDLADGRLPATLAGDTCGTTLLVPSLPGVMVLRDSAGRPRRVSQDGIGADFYRADGTRYLSERITRSELVPQVVRYDERGFATASYRTQQDLFHAWLDVLRGDGETFVITESGRIEVVSAIAAYDRPSVAHVHVQHRSHLHGAGGPAAPLASVDQFTFENIEHLDALVLLTRRQRDEVAERFGYRDNLCTIGHEVAPSPLASEAPAQPHAVMMVAHLDENKRVEHAVRAMPRVRESVPNATLTVYGEGARRNALEELISALGLADVVTLAGHVPDAADRFADAGAAVLCSVSEARPVVIGEAFARGCPYVAYDIAYGPSDLIVDGENGRLVPPGDIDALADAVVSVLTEPGPRLRRGALATAAGLTSDAVLSAWADILHSSASRRSSRTLLEGVVVGPTGQQLDDDGLTLTAEVLVAGRGRPADVGTLRVEWVLRGSTSRRTIRITAHTADGSSLMHREVSGLVPRETLEQLLDGDDAIEVGLAVVWNNSAVEVQVPALPVPAGETQDLVLNGEGPLTVRRPRAHTATVRQTRPVRHGRHGSQQQRRQPARR